MADVTDEIRLTLRMPASLRDRIASEIGKTGRSLNAEIVQRLEESFREEEGLWDEVNRISEIVDPMQDKFKDLSKKVDALWDKFGGGPFGHGD